MDNTAAAATAFSTENAIKARQKRVVAFEIALFHDFPEPFAVEERPAPP